MEEKTEKKLYWTNDGCIFTDSGYLAKKLILEKKIMFKTFVPNKKYKRETVWVFDDTPEIHKITDESVEEIKVHKAKEAKYRAEHSKDNISENKKDV